MYDTALPPDTLNTLMDVGNADIVLGIPSYRNGATIGHVTATVAEALHRYYPTRSTVIVHADGLAYDETLQVAQSVAMPPNVRQVTTRYLGLPGKGSALRAIFEAATIVQAHALVIIEADTISITPDWIPTLAEPILRKEAVLVLPHYSRTTPLALMNDVLAYPLLQGLYGLELRYPMAGEVAMAGGVAAYFADRDVWETDVAREAIDSWLALQIVVDGGQVAQVALPAKEHRNHELLKGVDVKFIQEAGILFRTGLLHERVWHEGERTPLPLLRIGEIPAISEGELPSADGYWEAGIAAIGYEVERQWMQILHPRTLEVLRAVLHRRTFTAIDARLWAYLLYDFLVVYNLGEGDPDKVLHALYPLYLLRCGTMVAEAEGSVGRWEQGVLEQGILFRQQLEYGVRRWESYVPPEE
jgi:hypothetical protein